MGSRAVPDVLQMRQRPCRGVFARLASAAVHGGVDEERQVVDGACSGGQPLHIRGVVPRHENLVGVQSLAEHLRPGALAALEALRHERMQRAAVRLQVAEQLLRNRLRKLPVGLGRVVAGLLQHAYLVLHLHHHHRALLCVVGCQVRHQSVEGFLVGLEHLFREGARYLQRFPVACHGAGEPSRVLFEPQRCVAAHGVFPGAEPQQYHLQLVFPGLLQGAVDEREVKLSLLGLYEVPWCRYQHRVQAHLRHAGHHLGDVFGAGGGRVAQFAAQHQHGLSVDGEAGVSAVVHQPHLCLQRERGSGEQQ